MKSTWRIIKDILNSTKMKNNYPEAFWINGELISDKVVLAHDAPVNNWLHSLFIQVDVHLNDTIVTPSSNTYPFRAYVETFLSYGAEARKTKSLASCGTRIRPDTRNQRNRTPAMRVWWSGAGT